MRMSVCEWPQVSVPFALMWVPTTRIPAARPISIVSRMPSVPVSGWPSTIDGSCQSGRGDWLRWWE